MKGEKITSGLEYERFAQRESVTNETERLRELRNNGEADRRTLRQAEKRVSKAKRSLRRTF